MKLLQKIILIVPLIFLTGVVFSSCARKAPEHSLELVLKERQDSLSRSATFRSAEQKQIAMLVNENEKIRAAMAGFQPGDPGYGALAEALAENKASLAKLGYGSGSFKK